MKRSPLVRKTPLRAKGPTRRAGIARPTTGAKRKGRTPLAKVGKQKAKRQASNAAYYRSAEWRAKKKAVHERDGYRCTEGVMVPNDCYPAHLNVLITDRCPNRGEIVNGKQTARGLVAEEEGHMHRGVPGAIDRIRTRCKDCDRRQTPLERINHAHGFQQAHTLSRTTV